MSPMVELDWVLYEVISYWLKIMKLRANFMLALFEATGSENACPKANIFVLSYF